MGDEITRIRTLYPKDEVLNLPLGEIIRMGLLVWHLCILL
jgi:hypothetical protein